MKKLLSLAVLAGLATTANAVNLSEDGTGEVLLFPYYTARNDLMTSVTLVNTNDEYKAVKVRFYEGVNSWEVLDFNLYLSPYDVWNGAIVDAGDGVAKIVTGDNSCTVPALTGDNALASTSFITEYGTNDTGELGKAGNEKTRTFEGHFDVIEMGVIDRSNQFGEDMAQYILHGSDGVPGDCAKLVQEWSNGNDFWNDQSTTYAQNNEAMLKPTGGIFGSATIVNAASGTATAVEPTAIDNFYTAPVHNTPGNDFPSVTGRMQNVNADLSTVTTEYASTDSYILTDEGLFFSTWDDPAKAISALLMTSEVANEYLIDSDMAAATDWVVTFPTKHYFTNYSSLTANYKYATGQYGGLKAAPGDVDAYEYLTPEGADGVTYISPFRANYAVGIENFYVYDREEGVVETTNTSANIPEQPVMYYETNVLEFSDDRNIFGSELLSYNSKGKQSWKGDFTDATLPSAGFARLVLDESSMTSTDGDVYTGYPLIGFSAMKASNTSTLANYTINRPHAKDQAITSGGASTIVTE